MNELNGLNLMEVMSQGSGMSHVNYELKSKGEQQTSVYF